jgi:hypothetical protein
VIENPALRQPASAVPAVEAVLLAQFRVVGEQSIRESARIGERNEVPAGDLVDRLVQPFAGDSLLKRQWKESIVGAGKDADRDVRPGIESAGLREDHPGLFALVRSAPFRATDRGTSCRKYVATSNSVL